MRFIVKVDNYKRLQKEKKNLSFSKSLHYNTAAGEQYINNSKIKYETISWNQIFSLINSLLWTLRLWFTSWIFNYGFASLKINFSNFIEQVGQPVIALFLSSIIFRNIIIPIHSPLLCKTWNWLPSSPVYNIIIHQCEEDTKICNLSWSTFLCLCIYVFVAGYSEISNSS